MVLIVDRTWGQNMSVHDRDEKILSELERTGYTRRKDLLTSLTDKYAKQKGFSTTSLNRRISELIRAGTIVTIEPKDFSEYGISDEDKRAKYLTSASYVRKKERVDLVVDRISKGDDIDQYLTAKEIKRVALKSPLTPSQLTNISKILGNEKRTDEVALEILHQNLLQRKINLNEEDLEYITIQLSRAVGEYRYPLVNPNKKNIVDMMGFFCSDDVAYLLKDDIEEAAKKGLLSEDDIILISSSIKDLYHSKYLVRTLEDNKDSILEEMWRYNEEGKKEGLEYKRKLALILDALLDYVAENKDKAVYYDNVCGARK